MKCPRCLDDFGEYDMVLLELKRTADAATKRVFSIDLELCTVCYNHLIDEWIPMLHSAWEYILEKAKV